MKSFPKKFHRKLYWQFDELLSNLTFISIVFVETYFIFVEVKVLSSMEEKVLKSYFKNTCFHKFNAGP